jgi:hypothetical protein
MTVREAQRFSIRFDEWYRWLSTMLWLRPADSYVDVGDPDVVVRMGWAFQARFPRAAASAMRHRAHAPMSRGVHGFGGRWLVNGSGDNVVTIVLEPAQRARVLGISVRLHELLVSVDDPDELVARLHGAG